MGGRSYELKRVVRSTLAGETLGVSDSLDRAYGLKACLSVLWGRSIESYLYTDCHSLYDYIHSHRQVTERRLVIEISMIKHLLQAKELNGLHWIAREKQLADCLTKKMTSRLLLQALEHSHVDLQ